MEPAPKPRRPWIAALFSLLISGLGQLYDGRPRRALAVYAAPIVLVFILFLIGLHRTFPGLVILLTLVVLFRLWVVWDAAAIARRSPGYIPRWFNRWYVYLGIIILVFLLPGEEILGWMPLPVRSFKIPSVNMEPAVREGDRITAEMRYDRSAPRRGDLVIYVPPDATDQRLCRVIGLPGEQIEIRNKVVYIDGKPLSDPWGEHQDPLVMPTTSHPRDNYPTVAIPEGSVFLLGDNRDYSYDSRFFGFVPLSNLKGSPLYVYWATDRSRIGTSLQ